MPLLDLSHQGLATGSLERDAAAVKGFVEKGLEICAIQSYSKNLGLRQHRIGALHFLLSNSGVVERVQSQLRWIATGLYAFPAIHGARIVTEILNDPALLEQWSLEIRQRHSDIDRRREALTKHLIHYAPERDWTYLSQQKGLYVYTSLTPLQVCFLSMCHIHQGRQNDVSQIGKLRRDYGLCIQDDSRISLVHCTTCSTEAIAKAMVAVLRETS